VRHPDRFRFRPTVGDTLEERVVPSQGGPSLSAIRDRYITEFRAGFRDLRAALQNDAANQANLIANGTSLDAQIQQEVGTLATRLTGLLALSPLAQNGLTPAIQNALVGTNGLANRLRALEGSPTFVRAGDRLINNTEQRSIDGLRAFFSPSNPRRQTAAASATNNVSTKTLIAQRIATEFQAAFASLSSDFTTQGGTALFNAQGQAVSAESRGQFDQRVQSAVTALANELDSMLSLLPRAGTQLAPAIRQQLLSTNPGGLLAGLQSLNQSTADGIVTAQEFQQNAPGPIFSAYQFALGQLGNFFGISNLSPSGTTGTTSGNTSSGGTTGTGSTGTGTTGTGTTGTGTTGTGSTGTGSTGTGSTGTGTTGTGTTGTGSTGGLNNGSLGSGGTGTTGSVTGTNNGVNGPFSGVNFTSNTGTATGSAVA